MKLFAAAVALVVALVVADPINTKCPYTGKAVDASKTVDYKGATIAFCCDNCVGKFNKAPDTEIKKVKEYKAKKTSVEIGAEATLAGDPVNAKCPYTGKAVDASKTVDYKGKTVGFCCGGCVEKFNKNPDAEAKKVKELSK